MARVLIDPVELRRGASRLRDGGSELELAVSSLGCVALPEMPYSIVGEVRAGIDAARSTLTSELPELAEGAVELDRRALWAEVADKLEAGAPLSGLQQKQFLAWMKDGSLLRYADKREAGLAGAYIGAAYRDTFKNPRALFDLATILKGSQQNTSGAALEEFSRQFVERFGAANMVLVPRVIQAIEWSHVINNTFSASDQRLMRDVAREWGDKKLDHDPVNDLLAPFSLALANATYSGRLTRTTERAIAQNDDTWSTAQLLSTGVFGKRFLLDAFAKGVVQQISDDSRYRMAGQPSPGSDPYTLGRFWEGGEHDGLSYDTKELILDALARNPDAAQAALTTDLQGVKAWDKVGREIEVTNPIRLLYDHGDWSDDGASFGRAYESAGDALRADPADGAAVDRANRLTLDVVDRVLNGEEDLDGVTDSLARDLGSNHLYALHDSATSNRGYDPDGGSAGYLDSADGRIHLARQEVSDLLSKITEREGAGREFLNNAARFQADSILAGTRETGGDLSWAYRAGAFDQLLIEAGDVNRLDDFGDAEAKQKMIAGFVNDVVSLVHVNPLAGIALDHVVDAATGSLAPSESELVRDNNRAHALIENGLTAAIVQGYADNGHIDLSGADKLELVNGDQLIRYNALDDIPRARFDQWMNNDEKVNPIAREALQEASR